MKYCTRIRTLSLRISAIVASCLLLAACAATAPATTPALTPIPQIDPVPAENAAPAIAPVQIPPKTPTLSPGAEAAARQRAAFPAQEQLRAAEAARKDEILRQQEAQEQREQILGEIARRAAENRTKLLNEQAERAVRRETISAACGQARTAEIAADYRGERPSALTRRVLAACNLESSTDRWAQLNAVLPEARLEWQALAEAEAETWARAEQQEAEFRLDEAVRLRLAEIEEQSRADRVATEQSQQGQSDEASVLERAAKQVASALPAPLVQLVRQSLAQLHSIASELGSRVGNINQRATSGAITALALNDKIPRGIRAASQDAMRRFISSRHVSHRVSVVNNPALAAAPRNLTWEPTKWNLARGSRNMSSIALLRANAHIAGAVLKEAGPEILIKTGQGCVIGAVLELPVAIAEQRIPVLEGEKSTEEAMRDVAGSVARTGLVGCALTAAAATAAATGALPLGTPVLIPVTVVGGSVYVVVTSVRIWNSLSEEEQTAVLGQVDVAREVIGNLASSTWASAHDGATVVATAIQETADAAGWLQDDRPGQDSQVES